MMYGEIDLEIFTISIIQLNNAFQKLNDGNENVKDELESSYNSLKELSDSLDEIIHSQEINATEVEPFLTYSINSFPAYKNQLENYNDLPIHLNEIRINLIDVFDKLTQIADEYFKNNGVMI